MSHGPIERSYLWLCAAALLASWALASGWFALSLAVGALLQVVNFRGLRRSAELFFGGRLPGGWGASFGLRFALLAGAIFAALHAGAHPLGLLIGLSLIVPAALVGAWQMRPAQATVSAAPPPDDPSWDRWNAWLARERDEDDDGDDW